MELFSKLKSKLVDMADKELNGKIASREQPIRFKGINFNEPETTIGYYRLDLEKTFIKPQVDIWDLTKHPNYYANITNYSALRDSYVSWYVNDRMNVILHNLTRTELAASPEDIVNSILEDL